LVFVHGPFYHRPIFFSYAVIIFPLLLRTFLIGASGFNSGRFSFPPLGSAPHFFLLSLPFELRDSTASLGSHTGLRGCPRRDPARPVVILAICIRTVFLPLQYVVSFQPSSHIEVSTYPLVCSTNSTQSLRPLFSSFWTINFFVCSSV